MPNCLSIKAGVLYILRPSTAALRCCPREDSGVESDLHWCGRHRFCLRLIFGHSAISLMGSGRCLPSCHVAESGHSKRRGACPGGASLACTSRAFGRGSWGNRSVPHGRWAEPFLVGEFSKVCIPRSNNDRTGAGARLLRKPYGAFSKVRRRAPG